MDNEYSIKRLRKIYEHMKGRCYCKTDQKYKNYGGRGIKICEEWLNDFYNFYNWAINNGYRNNLSIDRINNNGNYEPSNCRWATNEQQANNRTTSKYYTYRGETKTIAEWSKITGINVFILYYRINHNFKPDEVMCKNKYKNRHSCRYKYNYNYKGKKYSVEEVANLINKSKSMVHYYFRRGYSIEDMLEGRNLKYARTNK